VSYRSLLIHSVTVTTPGTTIDSTDRYGNPVLAETSADEPARVTPTGSEEELTNPVNRDTRSTRFKVFLLSTTTATGLSTILWEGRTLKVDGEPRRYDDRRVGHHVELDAIEELG